MNTTFVNRANTNAKVYEEASKIAYPSDDDSHTVKPFSRYYAETKGKFAWTYSPSKRRRSAETSFVPTRNGI